MTKEQPEVKTSFAWSASSNCAENCLLFCFSATVSAFQVFSPLDFKLLSYNPPLECFSPCVLIANLEGGCSAGGTWERCWDPWLLFLGPADRKACVLKRCLLFSAVQSYRTTSADIFCNSVFVLTNQQKGHLFYWYLLLVRFVFLLCCI